ncbi:DUF3592 domain-containing protein [Prosthecobacter sp.]|uniref:DUF3592 domain-containing protein n=1 Tax=Prosthecobacter sp. TaxID=1965333 RepID=UPI001D7D98AB|nr:DUF3592 domain-containing protein [Prosthecobacter sp.]MCB1277628.1 DUF3592 domain-containing protein [Prosthecobacter sp.]
MSPPVRHSSRQSKQLSGGCAVLFGLPFIVAGLAIGGFLYFPAITTWWSARGWEEVPCWIESADMKTSHSSKGGSTQKTEAQYRYRYRGQTYHSDEVGLTGGSDNIGDFQEKAHAQIRQFAGGEQPFRCFVNPARPEQAVLFRDLRWGLMLLTSVFPLLFPLAGFAVSVGGGWEARKAARARRQEKAHPGEPWRWRTEWEGETVQASTNVLPILLIVTGWILLVEGPLALAIIVSGELMRVPLSALALLPLLLAWIPGSAAWRRLKTRLAFGHPSLWLKQRPVRPGHTFEGELRFDRVLSPRAVVEARLLCQRQITRLNGKGRMTTKETLWEHSETLSAAEARREMNGVAVPLRVEIPRGLPCSVVEETAFAPHGNEEHLWTLELTPGNGGKPAVFPLPVFRTAEDSAVAVSEAPQRIDDAAPDTEQLVERLQRRGVQMEFDAAGLPVLIDCPPGRFRGMAVFLLIFGALWSAAFVFMVKGGAPFIFRFIWGITSPLFLGMGLWTLLHRRRVEITPDELRILNSIGPFYSWREAYAPRHFTGFTHDSNMQSGNQFYYRVRAETTFGKTPTLIDGITESITAETLAKRFEEWRKRG